MSDSGNKVGVAGMPARITDTPLELVLLEKERTNDAWIPLLSGIGMLFAGVAASVDAVVNNATGSGVMGVIGLSAAALLLVTAGSKLTVRRMCTLLALMELQRNSNES